MIRPPVCFSRPWCSSPCRSYGSMPVRASSGRHRVRRKKERLHREQSALNQQALEQDPPPGRCARDAHYSCIQQLLHYPSRACSPEEPYISNLSLSPQRSGQHVRRHIQMHVSAARAPRPTPSARGRARARTTPRAARAGRPSPSTPRAAATGRRARDARWCSLAIGSICDGRS